MGIFLLDIFWLKQLYYFYFALPLFLIPTLMKYFKHICFEDYLNIKQHLKVRIEILDYKPYFYIDDDFIPKISLEQYLNKISNIRLDNKINPYRDYICLSDTYIATSKKKQDDKSPNFVNILKHYMSYLSTIEKLHIIYLWKSHLLIYFCYFITWLYISIFKFYTLYPEYVKLIITYDNPFYNINKNS